MLTYLHMTNEIIKTLKSIVNLPTLGTLVLLLILFKRPDHISELTLSLLCIGPAEKAYSVIILERSVTLGKKHDGT